VVVALIGHNQAINSGEMGIKAWFTAAEACGWRFAISEQTLALGEVAASGQWAEHPLRDRLGTLQGRRVCIVGDVLHSRVARSNIWGLTKLGAEVAVCGPRSLLPNAIGEMGVTVFDRIEAAIEWADALNVLRLQLERMQAGYIPSLREYNRVFGVTRARLERAPRDLLILHPGPMNRGVEIDSDVADGPQSVILDQVTNGVAVRMAVLYLLAGGRPELAEAAKTGGA
jgi:aspartate carbamoyltransferase catalytic subunit